MRDLFRRIADYINRSWEEERAYTPKRLKILPPFLFEILAYLLGLTILYHLLAHLWTVYK